MITFTIYGEPVPKGRPRYGRGHVYTPRRTHEHERRIWAAAVRAGVKPTDQPVRLSCVFCCRHPLLADVDNLAKCVMDGLAGTAYGDDRQVLELHALKVPEATRVCTVVTVEEILA